MMHYFMTLCRPISSATFTVNGFIFSRFFVVYIFLKFFESYFYFSLTSYFHVPKPMLNQTLGGTAMPNTAEFKNSFLVIDINGNKSIF